MKSNYKKLGDYIRQIDKRNIDKKITRLLGVTLNKTFIPSVANTIGTDMSKYKILRRGQFACKLMSVGRDEKLPINLLQEYDEAIVSSAYYVFETVDEEVLLAEYLMMWFSRSETDRWVGFVSGGDVRGGISWEIFCEMPILVPSIEKQREIVQEYNVIKNRIQLNETINQKLEETAQTIYKQWFVDFEFPDENGKPYKSNGGKMIFNPDLEKEIPENWEVGTLENYAEILDGDRGKNYPNQTHFVDDGYCLFLNTGNVTKKGFDFTSTSFINQERDELLRKGKLNRYDIVLTTRGTIGNVAFYSESIDYEHIRINSGMVILRPHQTDKSVLLYNLMKSNYMQQAIDDYSSGSAQPQIPIKDIRQITVLFPSSKQIKAYHNLAMKTQKYKDKIHNLNLRLNYFQHILLSKMSQV